jgi:hypothetical protein
MVEREKWPSDEEALTDRPAVSREWIAANGKFSHSFFQGSQIKKELSQINPGIAPCKSVCN